MKKYFSLVLFAHTIFAMPFAFIGFFLAISVTGQEFNWLKLLLMILCMIFARNAAMAFNRYLDRGIDLSNLNVFVGSNGAGKTNLIELMDYLIKSQILFKSNLSRGLLLIHSNWKEKSIDYNKST